MRICPHFADERSPICRNSFVQRPTGAATVSQILTSAGFMIELDVGPASKCPLWVKSRHVRRKTSCPLYPRKRTSVATQSLRRRGCEMIDLLAVEEPTKIRR